MYRLLLIFLLAACAPLAQAADPDRATVMRILHMLDYIGVDYGEFVRDGEILSTLEYAEQQEFAAAIAQRLATLPAHADRADLLRAAQQLRDAIAARAPGEAVATLTRQLGAAVLAAYPVPLAPRRAPDMSGVTGLYSELCAGCHGANGHGDGPAGRGLEPAPTNFHDAARQQQRSVFGLYNVITSGVPDTGMQAYASLPESQRWALAFHVGQLIYDDAQRQQGQALFASGERAGLVDLAALSRTTPADVAAAHGSDGVALMAWLRGQPAALSAANSPLDVTRRELARAAEHYVAGDVRAAADAALSAYLDGYELQEAAIRTLRPQLNRKIEEAMLALREAIATDAPAADITARIDAIDSMLDRADEALRDDRLDAAGSFVASFVILTREGLEAILVLAALFAFLVKVGRHDAVRYVHYGWIAALAMGGLTWFAASHLIEISGASRELTEGASALLAAVVLLSVGLWMHNKSLSDQWQRYIAGQMQKSLDHGALWGIAALAFIATYREVFETVLFYQALWRQGEPGPIVGGLLAAAIALVGLAVLILRTSRALPLRQFFAVSAVLIVILAVIFTGQGIQALQEAGVIASRSVPFVSLPLLGVYPTLQTLAAQGALLALSLWLMRRGRSAAAA